jgi:hypothetical protein
VLTLPNFKVRGAFSQLEQRLKTREESTTRLSQFHESELKYTCLIPELEASVHHLEDYMAKLERQLAINAIRAAAHSGDARSITCIMNSWSMCLEVQQAGCRGLKSLGAMQDDGAGGKASLARSTQHRVVAALTQCLRAFKSCRVVQEAGLIALAKFMVKGGRVARLESSDAAACLSDCLHSMRTCAESVGVCTAGERCVGDVRKQSGEREWGYFRIDKRAAVGCIAISHLHGMEFRFHIPILHLGC